MDRLLESMRGLAEANNYLSHDITVAIAKLEAMQQAGSSLESALMTIPDICPLFLEWIGMIDVELPDAFIDRYNNSINWTIVSASIFKPLSNAFIVKYANYLDWAAVSWYQTLSEPTMRMYVDRLNWESICYSQNLSESFMRDHADLLDWSGVRDRQSLSTKFIHEFKDNLKIH